MDSSLLNTCIIYTPVDTIDTAEKMAKLALQQQYAICVNIIRQAVAMYVWEGEIKKTHECLIIFNTLPSHADALCTLLRQHHPYDRPAIVTISTKANIDFADHLQTYLNKSPALIA